MVTTRLPAEQHGQTREPLAEHKVPSLEEIPASEQNPSVITAVNTHGRHGDVSGSTLVPSTDALADVHELPTSTTGRALVQPARTDHPTVGQGLPDPNSPPSGVMNTTPCHDVEKYRQQLMTAGATRVFETTVQALTWVQAEFVDLRA